MASNYKIAVVGLWHCGEIYSACLAELGHNVVGISDDEDAVLNLQKGIPPLPEPELEDLLKKNIFSGKLSYVADFEKIKNCDVVWFTYDTPVDDKDEVDMVPIYAGIDKTTPMLNDGVLVVMSSQVPVGTAAAAKALITKKRPELKFDYIYTPENLQLGRAVECFMKPGRVVVGAESDTAYKKMQNIFSPLKTDLLRMSPASAEMSKHALNAYLATSISFMNDIADVCEATDADVLDVIKALRSDPRIGPRAFLDAGMGFSGGTLGRDLKALQSIARKSKISVPVVESVYAKNESRKELVVHRLEGALGNLKGKKIAILGLTYKPGTKTLRRSRALEIAEDLGNKGAIFTLYDPAVLEKDLPKTKNSAFAGSAYEAVRSANGIVIITPWQEFRNLNFKKITELAAGAVLLDTANLLYDKVGEIKACGLKYMGIGR